MADTITISNPDVVRDIETLAKRTGREPAEAVADAVRAKLGGEGQRERSAADDAELAKLLAEIDALPKLGKPITDADLYDEDGMPR